MVQDAQAELPAFQLVVAATLERGIGLQGDMPWRLPRDMAYFKALTSSAASTKQNAVIMGRKTWDSIPSRFRPLKDRFNVVISRSRQLGESGRDAEQPHIAASFEDALKLVSQHTSDSNIEFVYVIGGGSIYTEALKHPRCAVVHFTEIQCSIQCDTFFPELDSSFKLWSQSARQRDGEHNLVFKCYVRPGVPSALSPVLNSQHEELQYLDLIRDVMSTGVARGDRTGTGTLSHFGRTMRFNLRDSFPLLTTKRVFWRGVAEELLWFISGSTNAKLLADKGVHIWDGNGSREFLDSRGLKDREEMDLGPVYGFQWRHFGAKYVDMHTDYTGQGVDQLANVIHTIKTNPEDRRIVMSAWNPADLAEMALPPCHMFVQFYVADGELSCSLYQRSCDLGLGVPFNIASYALLTRLVAQVCDLKAGDFFHVLGDAHVYSNHVNALNEQLKNEPRPFPQLRINPNVKDIDGFQLEDFEIIDYTPHKKIAMKMAV